MNKEQLIEFAKSAGMTGDDNIDFEDGVSFSCGISSLERFAALVAAHEREQCALVCDDLGARYWAKDDAIESLSCEECAAAIRSRKDAP